MQPPTTAPAPAPTRAPARTSPSNHAPTITVTDVTRRFTEDAGVFDLNIAVPAGIIFGLIGPSGSGKTTTVRLLTGVLKRDRGEIRVLGEDPLAFSSHTREKIGYMPQHFVLYPNLSVEENINFVSSLYGMGYLRRRKPIKQLLQLVELWNERGRLGSQLSGGMQRRLELACALVNNPTLLFADEPTAGIDPVLRSKFWEHFRMLRDQGRTLFITTQYVGEAAYCDLVGVMREGKLAYLDTPEGLRRTAMGGEVIEVIVDPAHSLDAAQLLERDPAIHDVRRSRSQPGLLYVYTDSAATTLPSIVNTLGQNKNIQLQQAEPYIPPFDDVFVRLMEQA